MKVTLKFLGSEEIWTDVKNVDVVLKGDANTKAFVIMEMTVDRKDNRKWVHIYRAPISVDVESE